MHSAAQLDDEFQDISSHLEDNRGQVAHSDSQMAFTQSQHSLSSVELLRRQYLQLVDPEKLKIPAMEILRLPEAQAKIFDNLFNDKFRTFPSPNRYKFYILKRIVDAIHLSIVDPEEDVGSPLSSPMAHFHIKPSFYFSFTSESSVHCFTDNSGR